MLQYRCLLKNVATYLVESVLRVPNNTMAQPRINAFDTNAILLIVAELSVHKSYELLFNTTTKVDKYIRHKETHRT